MFLDELPQEVLEEEISFCADLSKVADEWLRSETTLFYAAVAAGVTTPEEREEWAWEIQKITLIANRIVNRLVALLDEDDRRWEDQLYGEMY